MRQLISLVVLLLALSLAGSCTPANATPVGASVAISQALPAVGPGYSHSYDFTCTTTPQKHVQSALSYMCRVAEDATARVRIGGSNITTSANGPTFAADEPFGADVREEWCVATSGTVVISCRAMKATR